MKAPIQNSFTAGELSPAMRGRFDFAKYRSGAEQLKNWIVYPQGGIYNRPGTRFVLDIGAVCRFIPFEFSATQAYVLAFVDKKMYILMDGGVVVYPSGPNARDPVEITSPFAIEDVNRITYSQSFDTLFLACKGYVTQKLTRTDHHLWTFSDVLVEPELLPINQVRGVIGTQTPVYPCDIRVSPLVLNGAVYDYDPAHFGGHTRTRLPLVRSTYGSVSISWSAVPGATHYAVTMTTPFGSRAVGITTALTITDTGATGTAPTLGTGDKTFETPSVAAAWLDDSSKIFHAYRVAYLIGSQESPLSGSTEPVYDAGVGPYLHANRDRISLGMFVPGSRVRLQNPSTGALSPVYTIAQPTYPNTDISEWFLEGDLTAISTWPTGAGNVMRVYDLDGYAFAYIANPWPAGEVIAINWVAPRDASGAEIFPDGYRVFKEKNGEWGLISDTEPHVRTLNDDNKDPDLTQGPRGPLVYDLMSTSSYYPAAVAIFQQRLILANTPDDPSRVNASRTGDFFDFTASSSGAADDAISARPGTGQSAEVRHMVPRRDGLICFTAGSEIVFRGSDGVLKYDSLVFDSQSDIGCSYVAPIVLDKSILFLQRNSKVVRDLSYALSDDGYAGSNRSILADHLFKNNAVVSWAKQQDPHNMVWSVHTDGAASLLTYLPDQDVIAFASQETDGDFRAVGSCRGDTTDYVYFCVERVVEDVHEFYVEVLLPRTANAVTGCFLDSSLSYSGAPATVFSDLDHLEGRTVRAVADGVEIDGLVVTSGDVTLPEAASVVHIGLPYVSDCKPLPFDLSSSGPSNFGKQNNVAGVVLRLEDTRGLAVGPDADALTEIESREDEGFDDISPLRTEDVEQPIEGDWKPQASFLIRQAHSTPAAVLAVSPLIDQGD